MIDRTLFSRNKARGGEGGALYSYYGSLACTRSNFTRNAAASRGGALSTRYDAGVYDSAFADNTAGMGGAVYHRAYYWWPTTKTDDS